MSGPQRFVTRNIPRYERDRWAAQDAAPTLSYVVDDDESLNVGGRNHSSGQTRTQPNSWANRDEAGPKHRHENGGGETDEDDRYQQSCRDWRLAGGQASHEHPAQEANKERRERDSPEPQQERQSNSNNRQRPGEARILASASRCPHVASVTPSMLLSPGRARTAAGPRWLLLVGL
jgi:hypothetical protein